MKIKRLLSVFVVLMAIRFLPGALIWLYQTLIFRLNPFAFLVLMFIIILILIPFIIRWYRWLTVHWFTENNWEPFILFAFGALCWFMTFWKLPDSTLDLHFHDTYYIISFALACRYIGIGFGILAIIYFAFPLISKIGLILKLSRVHFWITYIGLNVLVENWSMETALGPRRYIEYAGWDWYNRVQIYDNFIFTVLILVISVQLIFLFNMVFSFFRKGKITMNQS